MKLVVNVNFIWFSFASRLIAILQPVEAVFSPLIFSPYFFFDLSIIEHKLLDVSGGHFSFAKKKRMEKNMFIVNIKINKQNPVSNS